MTLLTREEGNAKLVKGKGERYLTVGLFLSPGRLNSKQVNLCPFASPHCLAGCLNLAGMGQFRMTQRARRRRSNLFLNHKQLFYKRLVRELELAQRRAIRQGKQLVVRLNGTSDIDWPAWIFDSFEGAQFYDYTKSPYRMRAYLEGRLPKNYHITFSHSGENLDQCREFLSKGGNVSVVFASADFPEEWQGYPVRSGEQHDLRFLDPPGHVIGLKAKGPARHQESSFVQITKGVAA